MAGFSVTYETVTPKSAEIGDAAERGFLLQDASFRDAIETFNAERDWTIVEADSHPISAEFPPRWLTDCGEMQFASGETRSVSLHIPEGVTGSSAIRIARLVNCYGAERAKES